MGAQVTPATIWNACTTHPDPLVQTANRFALLLASNQPFYPLYVWYFVGEGWTWALMTLVSTPFFLAVPFLSRRHPLAGRALLALAGIGNTFLCLALFGQASLVALFLAPCAVLVALLFRAGEQAWTLILLAIGLGGFLALQASLGAPAYPFSQAQFEAFARLNIYSVSALTAMIAWLFAGQAARQSQ